MTREQAYDLVQKYAMEAWETSSDFLELLLTDSLIVQVLPEAELRACFDLSYHLTGVDKVFARLGL
jgi:adenylosuccinate lyase